MSHRNARLTVHGRRLLVERVRSGRPGGDSRARAVRHGWAQPWGRMTARPLTFPACRRSYASGASSRE